MFDSPLHLRYNIFYTFKSIDNRRRIETAHVDWKKRGFVMDFQPSYKEFALIFKALSDETRLRVIDMLSCREMSACDILSNFTLSQSTLSYHMKILIESGVVNARREGLWTKYRINDETFTKLMDFLPELYTLKDKCICEQIKYCKAAAPKEGKDVFGN